MVKIVDKREDRGLLFGEIRMGETFWSPTLSCFMMKIEGCGCDECGGSVNAVKLQTGTVYDIELSEIVEPCRAEIQIFNC